MKHTQKNSDNKSEIKENNNSDNEEGKKIIKREI